MPSIPERTRQFDCDVVTDDGRVDVTRLASAMDLTLAQLAKILGIRRKKLTESSASRNIQEPAIKFVGMMNDVADFVQEKKYAVYWLRTPQRELGDRTALDWLLRGKLDEIRDHVARAISMQPD